MYHSGKAGVQENTYYKNAIEIRNADDLAAACLYDNVCVQFANNHRSNADFQRCFAIAADCDNSGTDNPLMWITPATVAERLPGVQFYDCASRNNNKTKHAGEPGEEGPRPRYHYYFPLSEPITDIKQARAVMSMLLRLFPEFDDNGTKPAQFFYGHSAPETAAHDGTIDIVQYLASRPDLQPKPEPKQAPKKTTPNPRLPADKEDYFTLNIEDALKYISPDDYDDWIKVGQGLYTAGKKHNVNCFDLWDSWSSGSKLYKGIEETRKKWATFKDAGADRTADERTIFNMAKSQNWHQDPDKLTGEYKAKHEERVKRIAEEKRIEEEFQTRHNAEHAAALAAVGIDCAGDPYRYTWTLDFDGAIDEVVEKATGEIKYHRSEEERAAARAAANSLRPDPQQQTTETINGVVVHNVPGAAAAPSQDETKKVPSLVTFDADYFNNTDIEPPEPIIDQLLFPGLGMLGSPAKMGKSYMMLQLAVCVATGSPFMGFDIKRPGPVLYMDLQGTRARTKKRLNSMGYDKMPQGITLTYNARATDNGLFDQLTEWITNCIDKPSLIIIDMLEQVKGAQRRTEDAYRADNRILEPLHEIALKYNLSIFCVMHTRKGNKYIPEDDPFNEIIGSVAQFGTADCAWMIIGKRNSDNKRFSAICRDNDDGQQDYEARFEHHRWSIAGTVEACVEKRAQEEYEQNPIVYSLRQLIQESGGSWLGTMKDLINEVSQRTRQYPASTPEKMTKLISELEYRLSCDGILIQRPTSNGGRGGRRYRFYVRQPKQREMEF